ncbi:hypothetical protein niasHS_001564 [Heterodera schachtii]|uniref:Membrane-associated protein n=1 Tax=Heterodera schachtii TaxID=97005 RepID=A0ABD2KEC3_HETSC
MRFRFRRCVLLLLGTVLTALLIILLVTQRQTSTNQQGGHSSNGDEIGTNEDAEVRRLLMAGAGTDEDAAPEPNRFEDASAEMAPALMSLFPIGRFPPALHNNGTGNALTLNLAIVLIVSLLSIAILITAICCVIIVALALDSSPTHRWSSRHSSAAVAARSSDLFLSSWPHMASQYHRLNQSPVFRTPGLAKLFSQKQEQLHRQQMMMAILNEAPVDTPPLTDDEDYVDEMEDEGCWHRLVEEGQRQAPADLPLPTNGHGTAQPRRNSFSCASTNTNSN